MRTRAHGFTSLGERMSLSADMHGDGRDTSSFFLFLLLPLPLWFPGFLRVLFTRGFSSLSLFSLSGMTMMRGWMGGAVA